MSVRAADPHHMRCLWVMSVLLGSRGGNACSGPFNSGGVASLMEPFADYCIGPSRYMFVPPDEKSLKDEVVSCLHLLRQYYSVQGTGDLWRHTSPAGCHSGRRWLS